MSSPPGSARECGLEPPSCQQAHRLAIATVAFAQHADGQKSRSTDLHNDVADISRAPPPLLSLLLDYIDDRCIDQGRFRHARRSVITRASASGSAQGGAGELRAVGPPRMPDRQSKYDIQGMEYVFGQPPLPKDMP